MSDTSLRTTSQEVYEKIMRWLEGYGHSAVPPALGESNMLVIPVCEGRINPLDPSCSTGQLRFKREVLMGGRSRALSLDTPGFVINYDPNWETLLKIGELIATATAPKPEAK